MKSQPLSSIDRDFCHLPCPTFSGLPPVPSTPQSWRPPGTPAFWSSSLNTQVPVSSGSAHAGPLGWGPSRLSENATFPLAVSLLPQVGLIATCVPAVPVNASNKVPPSFLSAVLSVSLPIVTLPFPDNGILGLIL